MDELKEAWTDLKKVNVTFSFDREKLHHAIHARSHGVVERLTYRLKIEIILNYILIPAMGVAIIWIPGLYGKLLLGFIVFVLILLAFFWERELRTIKKEVDLQGNLKQTLKMVHFKVKRLLKIGRQAGLILIPLAVALGKAIAMAISYKSMNWQAFVIELIIMVPLLYLLTYGIQKKLYGNYLRQLENNIKELDM